MSAVPRSGAGGGTAATFGLAAGLALGAVACGGAPNTIEVSSIDLAPGETVEIGVHALGEITVDLEADGRLEACPAAAYASQGRGWAARWDGCIELDEHTALPSVNNGHIGIAFTPVEAPVRIDSLRVHYTAVDGYQEVCERLPCEEP